MKVLLDTHVLVWWLEESPRLSVVARAALSDPNSAVHVSVATAWEIAIKVGTGKMPEAAGLLARFEQAVHQEGFSLLPIAVAHVRRAGLLPGPHRDPFDRLLAAQAIEEGLQLATVDAKLSGLGASILW